MKFLATIIILIATFCNAKKSSSPTNLTCTIKTDKSIYKIGELPKFTVQILNNSNQDIYLIGSLDGSDVKWRYPHCYYTIESPKPRNTNTGRCGNMNSIRIADIKLIKAGDAFNPYENVDEYGFFGDYTTNNLETFKTPGVYKLKFHYSTNTEDVAGFVGDRAFYNNQKDSVQIKNLLQKVPKIELVSNEVEITFVK